jgi:hypothetical protein
VGFNDVLEGRFVTPPLTSVRLPFYEQGRRAVELLLALLAGEQVPEQVVLLAKLKVRQSCGCVLPSVVQAAAEPIARLATEKTIAAALTAQRESILDALVQVAEGFARGLDPGWTAHLFDPFAAEVAGDAMAAGHFLRELDQILRQVMLAGGHVQG